ncbi:hypothetical protein [Pseudotabrizicola alkalilacus]|uniref:Uncharacterized protein n=1 Tax=Pseudotabrizicola alkalilacus TaxID=2305252 RepID=A0A411Z3D5_9RHOB|nr:hypothetical protein [Pseudotabrizicola alkalilacus]RGP37577.1 hypothetical protein D1012_10290 [Pseudotabrizicola alkalilacus]
MPPAPTKHKPGPKPKVKGGSVVGQGFGTGRLHKLALLPDDKREHYTREIILGRMSMLQASRELGVSDMSVARFITTIPDEVRLAILAQAFHDTKVQGALKNAAIANEFGDDVDQDLKWVLKQLKALFEGANGDDEKLLKLGTLKEVRASLMALAELHGKLNKKIDIHLNLNESPQFIKLRQIILTVLDRHPEAKADFLDEMRVLKVMDHVVPA